MKKTTFFLVLFLLFTGCGNKPRGYTVNPITHNEISNQAITRWLEETTDDSGYHDYIHSDPDSWDMLIYYPNANKTLEYVFYKYNKIEVVDSTAKVYLTKEFAASDSDVVKDLLFVVTAPERGAWPTKSELFIDGEPIPHISSDFSQ